MAFPSVANSTSNEDPSFDSTYTVDLPTGITAGDLLIAIVVVNTPGSLTTPSGWNTIVTAGSATDQNTTRAVYRIATGSEGSSIDFAGSNNRNSWGLSYRITGYQGTPEGAGARAASGVPNPPNLTPSWGAKDTLWIAGAMNNATTGSITAPSNYTNLLQASTRWIVSAIRALNASSEDPGTFGGMTDQGNAIQAITLAVRGPDVTNVTVEATAQALTSSVPTPTISGAALIPVNTVVATFNVLAPTFSNATNVVIAAAAQVLTFSVPAATVSGAALVSAAAQVLTFSTNPVSFSLAAVLAVAVQVLTFTVNAPSRIGGFYQNKYSGRGTSYDTKYSSRETSYSDKYSTRNH